MTFCNKKVGIWYKRPTDAETDMGHPADGGDPEAVGGAHCSGANFIDAMRRRMPEKLVTSNVGSRFTFGI